MHYIMPNAEWIHSDLKFFCIRFQKEGRQAALNFLRFEPFCCIETSKTQPRATLSNNKLEFRIFDSVKG